MTTPGSDSFDYTDDSVIARVSFDIPPSTLTDISQITSAMGAMRTELESIARAQSDWLDYLSQVPQIAERANQAYRESITQMERMAYIQNEIGSGAPVGGGIGGDAAAGGAVAGGGGSGAGGGAAAYSTVAPSGYVNPFKGMTEGTGTAPSISAITEQINEATQGDPRLAANMMAARGIAVNPALLGMAGAAATGAIMGGGGSGGTATQPGGGSRMGNIAAAAGTVASAAANTNLGAAAGTFASQMASMVGNEIRNGMGGTKIGNLLGMGNGAGGSPPGSGPPGGGPPGTGGSGKKGMPLPIKVGGALAAGAYALNQAQNIGERITQFQQLGSEEGGDYATGMKNELTARVQALDPFINTEQSREAIQKPMSEGFKGEGRSELRELLTTNFKELGISMGDSMTIAMSNLRETSGTDADVKKVRSQEEATLNTMKEFAADGGASLSQRVAQQVESSINLNKMGFSQESIDRSSIALQEGYGDSVALRGKRIGEVQGQVMNSQTLMATVGLRNGVSGILPEAMGKALEEKGLDPDEIMEKAAAEIARYASSQPIRLNRIAVFMRLMGEQGVTLDFDEAEALYDKVTGGKDGKQPMPTQVANNAVARKGQKNQQTNWNPISYLKGILTAKPEDIPGEIMGNHAASQNAENSANNFVAAGRGPENFAPAGRKGQSLPQTPSQVPPVMTQGQVSGNVTITIDKNGNATAPAVIQLTGTQRAVNAGAGGAQLNNLQPGESPAANTFPGGR